MTTSASGPTGRGDGDHLQGRDRLSLVTSAAGAAHSDQAAPLQVARRLALQAFDERLRRVPVADIAFDSLVHQRACSVLPSAKGTRRLRWETTHSAVDIVVARAGDHVRLWARLQPRFRAVIDIRGQRQVPSIHTDDQGFARFDAPPGLASLVIAPAERPYAPCLQTAWVAL